MSVTYPLTSQSEIERVLSASGALQNVDDDENGTAETTVWDDIVDEATEIVHLYALKFYTSLVLYTSPWARRTTTRIGCHLATSRRGNPSLYNDAYDRAIGFLEKVATGDLQIPGLPTRSNLSPAMSNYQIDNRYNLRKTRVIPEISVGDNYAGRETTLDQDYGPG